MLARPGMHECMRNAECHAPAGLLGERGSAARSLENQVIICAGQRRPWACGRL